MKLITVCIFIGVCLKFTYGWETAEYEMFDLVEEVGENFYDVLGIKQESSVREIKQAYRKLSVKLHPDKNDAPDAETKFRQLVGIYEVLKDENTRRSYHEVLEHGLPDWKQPVFYFRRARRLALWQVALILLGIISVAQYLWAWAAYFEKRLSMQEFVEYKVKKLQRKRKTKKEGLADVITEEIEKELEKPSLWNIAPIQFCRFVKYMVTEFPNDLIEYLKEVKQRKEEELERLREEERLEKEAAAAAEEPKKPRKRKTFVIPEREDNDEETPQHFDETGDKETKSQSTKPVYISGGLWTDDDVAELTRLCAKYPGGTPERWEKISEALCRPVSEVTFMAKKMLDKINRKQEEEKEVESVPQVKVKQKTKGGKKEGVSIDSVANWSADEQKLLEQGLQMYPKGRADRWDKISNMITGRSKEECMQRFKYVAEMVKKKKEKDTEEATEEPAKPADIPEPTAKSIAPVPAEVPSENLEDEIPEPYEEPQSSIRGKKQKGRKRNRRRKDSISSNSSFSEGEWCVVDSP